MSDHRCAWAGDEPVYTAYHDEEWGVPVHDERALFEFLILEGAQAGLSWITILRKRAEYRSAFAQFDPAKVAEFSAADQAALLQNPGIVRNRLKINGAVVNAREFLSIQQEFGSFDNYLWGFVDGTPVQNSWKNTAQVPAVTDQSHTLSKDLKKRGFKYVGPTICYALMQAVGMVNDHTVDCFRHRELA